MSDDFFGEKEESADNTALAVAASGAVALSGSNFEQLMQKAAYLSKSTIIPATYQNKPENCFIAIELAQRIGASPMAVMQNMVPINGKPSWSSQFLTSSVNSCGRFTPIRYEWTGTEGDDDWGCRAYATEIATGEVLRGTKITINMAKAEGWYGKNGSKWKTMPEQMLMYRAAAFFSRTFAPEIAMGIHTSEEREDMINVTPVKPEESAAEKAWMEQTIDV